MGNAVTIYVALIGEGLDVWRPVKAEHVRDSVYKIVDQAYDKDDETWEFVPGDVVECRFLELSDGATLVATNLYATN